MSRAFFARCFMQQQQKRQQTCTRTHTHKRGGGKNTLKETSLNLPKHRLFPEVRYETKSPTDKQMQTGIINVFTIMDIF